MRKHECGSHYNKYDAPLLKLRASFEYLVLIIFFVALVLPVSAWATPQIIRVDGSVFDSAGVPVTASKDIQIKAYDAASGGTLLWTSSVYNTAVSTGKFTINLDAAAGSPSLVDRLGERTTSQAIYFQIEVDSGAANGSMDTPTIVLPRIRAKGTAFALSAASADALKGVTATAAEVNYLAGVSANVQSQINAVGGTASGVSAKVSKAGDSMSGALQVGANITSTGTVQAATLNSTAATASRFALFDSSKNLASSATTVTDTEFGFLSGVTANVQTQLNAKATSAALVAKTGDSMSGALQVGAAITSTGTVQAATVNATGLTANRALAVDASKNIVSSSVTDAELAYLSGVTSALAANINGLTANIQTQLDAKMISVAAGTSGNVLTSNGSSWVSQTAGGGTSGSSSAYRNTILSGAVGTLGEAAFLAVGTGFSVNLSASTTPLVLSFADGFDSYGAKDYVSSVTANVTAAWSSLPASSTSYLYIDRNSGTGALTYGYSSTAPIYGASALGSNAVPTMTSNTAPSGTASASSVFSASYDAWFAFDKSVATAPWLTNTPYPQWLKYDFGSTQSVGSYYVKDMNGATWGTCQPKDWTFQGSSDNSAWTTLDTQTNQTGWNASGGETRTYTLSSVASYRYYRINITAGNACSYAHILIGELGINSVPSQWFDMTQSKFKSWNGSSWVSVQRIFVGTATTNGSGVTAVSAYAPRGLCASDMVLSNARGRASSCIEKNPRASTSWYDAVTICGSLERKLCTVSEWNSACGAGVLSSAGSTWEFADQLFSQHGYYEAFAVVGGTGCSGVSTSANTVTAFAYRCCQDRL